MTQEYPEEAVELVNAKLNELALKLVRDGLAKIIDNRVESDVPKWTGADWRPKI